MHRHLGLERAVDEWRFCGLDLERRRYGTRVSYFLGLAIDNFVTPQGYTVGSGSANGSGAKDVVTSASSTKVKASTYTAELWEKKNTY